MNSTADNKLMSLSTNWFEHGEVTSASTTIRNASSVDYWSGTYYPTYYTPWAYHREPEITLTLTEVEHLRELAKGDKRLRKTLKKFAKFIAVEVDFPGGSK